MMKRTQRPARFTGPGYDAERNVTSRIVSRSNDTRSLSQFSAGKLMLELLGDLFGAVPQREDSLASSMLRPV